MPFSVSFRARRRPLSERQPIHGLHIGYDSPEEMIASITDIARQFFVNPKRRVEFMLVMEKARRRAEL